MNKCKYCNSENLILEPRVQGQDVMTADQVALKCGDCGKWLKWCPKDERKHYFLATKQNKEQSQADRCEELNTRLVEEMELSAERRQIIEDLTIENNQQDKEIKEQTKQIEELQQDVESLTNSCNWYFDENKKLKQAQKQLAIEELGKVINYIRNAEQEPRYWDIARHIYNQIKELKGGDNEIKTK